MQETSQSSVLPRGVVKKVISGDRLIVRAAHSGDGKPPTERTIKLQNIKAPVMNKYNNGQFHDHSFAFQSREFVRKELIGQEVSYSLGILVQGSPGTRNVFYGNIYFNGTNFINKIIAEGWAVVEKSHSDSCRHLLKLQSKARRDEKGIFGKEKQNTIAIPDYSTIFHEERRFPAIIEEVRVFDSKIEVDALMLPHLYYFTMKLSDVKLLPNVDDLNLKTLFFIEKWFLQEEVEISLQKHADDALCGSIFHDTGNLADLLIQKKFVQPDCDSEHDTPAIFDLQKCVNTPEASIDGSPLLLQLESENKTEEFSLVNYSKSDYSNSSSEEGESLEKRKMNQSSIEEGKVEVITAGEWQRKFTCLENLVQKLQTDEIQRREEYDKMKNEIQMLKDEVAERDSNSKILKELVAELLPIKHTSAKIFVGECASVIQEFLKKLDSDPEAKEEFKTSCNLNELDIHELGDELDRLVRERNSIAHPGKRAIENFTPDIVKKQLEDLKLSHSLFPLL